MPLPVIPGVVRASASGGICGGSGWSNTLHFRRADLGDPDLALVTILHVEILAFYAAVVFLSVPATTTLEKVDYTPLDGSSGAFSLPGSLTGGGGDGATPAEVAEVLTIRSALRGRQNRGRIYLPAFVDADWDALGHLTAGAITRVQAGATALAAAAAIAGWEWGVGSYGPYKNPTTGVLEVGTPHFTPAISFSCDNLGDVQRSRKS